MSPCQNIWLRVLVSLPVSSHGLGLRPILHVTSSNRKYLLPLVVPSLGVNI